jgi:hypothetical protein
MSELTQKTSVFRLWADPHVFVISDGHWLPSGLNLALRAAAGQLCYVLTQTCGHIPRRIKQLQSAQTYLQRHHPKARLIPLAPNDDGIRLFQNAGLSPLLCHHNALIDERIFYPDLSASKEYDAVHNAQAAAYKRHYLAFDVPRIAVITFSLKPDPSEIQKLTKSYCDLKFINYSPEAGHTWLKPAEVRRILNQAHCGLILSEVEGGNYASMEYLLSGVPVITTPSVGGRDEFFDKRHVVVVEPTASAVREAVERIVARALDPLEIRAAALARARVHRMNLVAWLSQVTGCDLRGLADGSGWLPQFRHKLENIIEYRATPGLGGADCTTGGLEPAIGAVPERLGSTQVAIRAP